MKHIIKLDRNDVIAIIANHFNVDNDKVQVYRFMNTEGYGKNEEQVPDFRIEVTETVDITLEERLEQ